jgi:hypothetical protein
MEYRALSEVLFMRTLACSTAVIVAALLSAPAGTWAQQSNQPTSQGQAQTQAPPAAPQQESLAEAARKAREQKKEAPKTVKTFTNDNLPTEGGISTVGETASAASTTSSGTSTATEGKGAASRSPKDEKAWRDRFQGLRHKLEQDQANLEVMQRELAQLNIQYYGDPNQQMQQQFTRSDINNKTADIDKMQAQVDADKQAIADAENELRESGGDPGWAR